MIIAIEMYLINDEIPSALASNVQHAVNTFSQFGDHGVPLVSHQLPFGFAIDLKPKVLSKSKTFRDFFCSKTLTFIRSSRRVVPITLYRFSGCSETCFSVQVVLPHPGSPMSMIISQSSRLPILQKQKQTWIVKSWNLSNNSLVSYYSYKRCDLSA